MEEKVPLLIVSHTFPPYRGIGGRRWVKFARALAQRGHAVHVLHSAGSDLLKGSLWTADAVHPNIHVHPLPQRYPAVLFRRPLTSVLDKLMYRFWAFVLPLVAKGNWLDKSIFWRSQFMAQAGSLIRTHDIRHVLVTGAPFRLFHFGVALKQVHSIKLLCDLRDPWTWHDGYGQSSLSRTRKAYERSSELEMMQHADRITSPHPSVIEHLRTAYPEQADKCVVLGHAIDPEELGMPRPPRADGRFQLIYAGSLYGAHEADGYFEELMAAFERVRAERPDRWPHIALDLHITGHGTGAYRALLQQRSLQDHIRIREPLPPKEMFARIAQADAVLVFIPSFNKDLLGTKFTEIFHLRRPVIHVGDTGTVSETIRRQKLGISIHVEALRDELPAILAGDRVVGIDTSVDLSAHELDHITARLAEDFLR